MRHRIELGSEEAFTARTFSFSSPVILLSIFLASAGARGEDPPQESKSRFSDKPIPLAIDEVPDRPKPLFELGDPFLGQGPMQEGIVLPTGAVWQPSLLVFGQYRMGLQTFDDGFTKFAEWTNSLSLFLELRLSGTERLVFGIRPLDEDGQFTSFNLQPKTDNDWQTHFNGDVTTLFFEGDLGEIFPILDERDFKALDIGFAVGRQQITIQEGMLINDRLDSIGLVRNTLLPDGTSNLRVTTLYAWDEINRGNNIGAPNPKDETSQLWGLFTEADVPWSTVNVDAVYVESREAGDAFMAGISAVQRIGHLNTSFRVNASFPTTGETALSTRGYLFFSEISWTPHHTHDLMYINGFYAIDQFSSAARTPESGGPLGRTGILYAAVGLGRYGAALGNQASDAYGVSIGYQKFFDGTRKQLIVEVGARKDTDHTNQGAAAIGARYQQAMGQHTIVQIDTFAAAHEDRNASYGARIEFLYRF